MAKKCKHAWECKKESRHLDTCKKCGEEKVIKSRLKKEQFEAARPFFPVIRQLHNSGVFAGGELAALDDVSQGLGNRKTDMWCAGCVNELLENMYDEIIRYDNKAFDF